MGGHETRFKAAGKVLVETGAEAWLSQGPHEA